jgi:hypothetical protein
MPQEAHAARSPPSGQTCVQTIKHKVHPRHFVTRSTGGQAVSEKEHLVQWLEQAKREIECHAEWWGEMLDPWCKARERQARDMANDLNLVIKEAKSPEVKQ